MDLKQAIANISCNRARNLFSQYQRLHPKTRTAIRGEPKPITRFNPWTFTTHLVFIFLQNFLLQPRASLLLLLSHFYERFQCAPINLFHLYENMVMGIQYTLKCYDVLVL